MPYIGSRPDNVISRNAQNEYNYTATGGQTVFTGADSNNNILSYTPGNIEVYFNGARLEESDFTATDGTSIILASAAVVNDELSVVAVNVFEVADVVPASTGGTFQGGIAVQGGVTVGGHVLPDTNITYDLGSNTQRFRDLYLSGSTIQLGTRTINQDNIPDVNLTIAPEVLEIQIDAPGAGQNPPWLWTWEQSTLPYARRTITNSPEVNVPLYKQGTYTVNNFAKAIHGSMTQTHTLYFKWIDGAGTENLVSWVTDQGTTTDSHPDINGGNSQTIQRLSISVPSTITLPTLTAPTTVEYDVSNNGTGAYSFAGDADGDNPNIGPLYRGGTYTFNITATGHPFYFTTDNGTNFASGTYFGEYTSGVTGSRTDSGTITFTVPSNAPDTLYYQCGNHAAMRGAITVRDLAVETNNNGNYVIYAQHDQEGHKTPIEIRPIPSLVNQMCLVYDASVNKFVPQDLATYVENTPSFENKIREVAGTAELVVEDGSAVVAKVNVYADSTYLPLVGNNAGDQAFATDINKLYIWDGTAWQQAGSATTDELTEGSTNLYYTDARVGTYLSSNGYDTATNIVASITDSAPATLDTLNELAAALGDDPNFATTTASNIATKVSKSGDVITTTGTNNQAPLQLRSASGLRHQFATDAQDDAYYYMYDSAGANTVSFRTDGNPSFIAGGGNVGIGTSSPSYPLDINGGTENVVARISSTDADALIVFEDNSTTDRVLLGAQGEDFLLRTDLGKFTFRVNNNATDGMVILNNGNVGIGTDNPISKLDVRGIITSGNDGGTAGSVILQQRYNTNDSIATLGTMYSSGGWLLGYGINPKNGSTGYVSSFDNFSGKRTALEFTNTAMQIHYASAQQTAVGSDITGLTTPFYFDLDAKNLGIGTTSPAEKLDIAGGSIRLDGGYNIEWGTGFNSGGPAIWGDPTNTKLRFAPQGNSSGITVEIADNLLTVDGDVKAYSYDFWNGRNTRITQTGPSTNAIVDTADTGAIEFHTDRYFLFLEADDGGPIDKINTYPAALFVDANYQRVVIGDRTDRYGTPSHTLDIRATDENTGIRLHRYDNTNLDPIGIGFSTRGDKAEPSGDTRAGVYYNYNGNLFIAAKAATNINSNPLSHSQIYVDGVNNRVGIGYQMTTPQATLHVDGDLLTNDLILNNMDRDEPNEVDGTRGHWTIQEGEEDLFLINRLTGKKYKFNITEVQD